MRFIKINENDNIAVALAPLKKGEKILLDNRKISLLENIQQGHKFALKDISKGEDIIKYGLPIAQATEDIREGSWVHTHNVKTKLSENTSFEYKPSFRENKISKKKKYFKGYKRVDGRVAIRNEIWIVPVVGCVNATAKNLEKKFSSQLKKYKNIDGIFSLSHPYGCSQIGEDLNNTKKLLASLIKSVNACGCLVVALGCENLTLDLLKEELGKTDDRFIKFLCCQEEEDEIEKGLKLLTEIAENINDYKREKLDASHLIVGLKCGGSDGLSGITANPLLGKFSDLLTSYGGSTILTEVPEMFGAESILFNKCENREVFDRACRMVEDFKKYFVSHGQVVYENPSPGNKNGGITTLEDKSCGCVQKGGSSKIVDVLGYADKFSKRGLSVMTGPGNDLVSCTALAASDCHLILFTTGRGTPFGTMVPTIKVSTNNALYNKKNNWIDFNAGLLVADNDKTKEKECSMDELSKNFFDFVLKICSGKRTKNEDYNSREIAIFKDGVTL